MTKHFSPEEFVEFVEAGHATPDRRAHLDTCDPCRREADDLVALMADVNEAREIPEPSPLFWDHFSARVRQATIDAPAPAARPSWLAGWRPFATFAAGAAALALVVLMRGWPREMPAMTPAETPDVIAAEDAAPTLDGPWDLVMGAASDMPWEDVAEIAMPRAGTADALIERLTPAQRLEFAKLLRAQIGASE